MLEFEYAANEDVFSEAFDAFVSNGAGSLDWGIGDPFIDTFNEVSRACQTRLVIGCRPNN